MASDASSVEVLTPVLDRVMTTVPPMAEGTPDPHRSAYSTHDLVAERRDLVADRSVAPNGDRGHTAVGFQQNAARLAMALLDRRAACEAELRSLTAMQQYLERIRLEDTSSGERHLLLGEIARQLDCLGASRPGTEGLLSTALRYLDAIRHDGAARALGVA